MRQFCDTPFFFPDLPPGLKLVVRLLITVPKNDNWESLMIEDDNTQDVKGPGQNKATDA